MNNGTYILGLSCFYHDSSAVITKGSEIIAAIQEERVTRIKFDNSFPINAINECFKIANVTIDDIDEIAFYEDPEIKKNRIIDSMIKNNPLNISINTKKIFNWINNKYPIEQYIKNHFPNYNKKIVFYPHHLSHASSAFYPSPFSEAAILTIDGVGEWCSTMISKGFDNEIKILKEQLFPHSIGLLYSSFTQAIGFKVDSGEYKLMGLAPYGKPKYIDIIKKEIVKIFPDGNIRLNLKYFDFISGNKMINSNFLKLFDLISIRKETEKIEQVHMDIAASIQCIVEEIILKLATYAKKITNSDYLCLAGGVALNCVANSKILNAKLFKDIWIQPAAGDSGGALGACFLTYYYKYKNKRNIYENKDSQKNSYLGNSYKENYIENLLNKFEIKFEKFELKQRSKKIAKLLSEDLIVGIFQGRMEFGPRALGNRSILGNPQNVAMQKIMNLKIKFRESFRPFAPIIKEDKVEEWFSKVHKSRYMLLVGELNSNKYIKKEINNYKGFDKQKFVNNPIPSVIHVDNSARLQTVTKESNNKLYNILDEFEKITNCPILINTSFNIRGEPIVGSPYDALKCFFNTNIDHLVIENFLISKHDQNNILVDKDFVSKFDLD